MGRTLAEANDASENAAAGIRVTIQQVAIQRIKALRADRRLSDKDRRAAILTAESMLHVEITRAMMWVLNRCSYHADQCMVPGSEFTEEEDN